MEIVILSLHKEFTGWELTLEIISPGYRFTKALTKKVKYFY